MNNSGKTLTIFLAVIAILMISLSTIAVFFFLKEVDLRKAAEFNLEQMRVLEAKLQADLKEATQKIFLSEEKIKESNDKIENLMEEIDLEKRLRDETKKENWQLKEDLEKAQKEKEDIRTQLSADLVKAEERVAAVQKDLDATVAKNKDLEKVKKDLETKGAELQKNLDAMKAAAAAAAKASAEPAEEAPAPSGQPQAQVPPQGTAPQPVALDKIVVNPGQKGAGKVISVDKEADFVIVSLGEKAGVKKGAFLSIYRGKQYLGDVKVSRVLPEMSAADFVAPLKGSAVKKDDQVVIK